jgi:hypothetical protein
VARDPPYHSRHAAESSGALGACLSGLDPHRSVLLDQDGESGSPVAYGESLKYSLTYWYIWGALTPMIIMVDRRPPAARDAILRRGLLHVPLSFLFTALYVYGLEGARSLLGLPSAFELSARPLKATWLDGSLATLEDWSLRMLDAGSVEQVLESA